MHKAQFFTLFDPEMKTVKCELCNHFCKINNGRRGLCKVRENQDGILYSLVYGYLLSDHIDPIEKKPIFHLLPASRSYSIATVGCNFQCRHCQNFEISQFTIPKDREPPGNKRSPEQVVLAAQAHNCQSISYTYVEPTIFYEFAYDIARIAHETGLANIFVSNGYTSAAATRQIAPYLTANNIDLKAFSEKFYHDVCRAKLAPVLETIALMKELGVWVEITTLIIPGLNDSDAELSQIANFIKSVDPHIPWHVTRFLPTYKMTARKSTPIATLQKAREIGMAAGLKYVYTGNIPGDDGENTYCPQCGTLVIRRNAYNTEVVGLRNGTCQKCATSIAGVF